MQTLHENDARHFRCNAADPVSPSRPRSSRHNHPLRVWSAVKPGDGLLAGALLVCVFMILTAYYVLKTAREGLILSTGTFGLRGDELKAYATGAMALLLIGLVPVYGALVNRSRRIRLINISYAGVVASLLGFAVVGRAGVAIGLAFFVWLGLVSVFLVAQFWSYANDVYDEEQGTRLFPIIAIGGSIGAIVGPRIAAIADTYTLLLIAAALLVGCAVLFNVIEHGFHSRGHNGRVAEPIAGPGGFSLVLHDRFVLLIAAMLLVANLVNTTGEFILSNAIREHAFSIAPHDAVERREIIKGFYSNFYAWVNGLSFLIQVLLVSRILRRIGVRHALFVLPLIAFGAYAVIGAVGGLLAARIGKIAENATDYSLQNTTRQALFLPTARPVKYKAKATVDTFFVRFGDALSAILVGIAIHQLGMTGRQLAVVNLLVIVGWVGLVSAIAHHHRVISVCHHGCFPSLKSVGAT
jgi:ATP:ADP antiporter, AAA family